MALIDVAGIHVRFGDRVVLESIDLSVPEGEFHGLMGPMVPARPPSSTCSPAV